MKVTPCPTVLCCVCVHSQGREDGKPSLLAAELAAKNRQQRGRKSGKSKLHAKSTSGSTSSSSSEVSSPKKKHQHMTQTRQAKDATDKTEHGKLSCKDVGHRRKDKSEGGQKDHSVCGVTWIDEKGRNRFADRRDV